MARYPGATFVNQVPNRILPLNTYNRVNLHVTAGRGENAYNEPSHFYVQYDGDVRQYFDTIHQGQADLDGNDATISIETEGVEGEEWTPAQVEAIIKLVVWIIVTHDIPRKLATDSKVGSSSHGLSWHRLGIDGNFPSTGILAGRLQRGGGMHYSTARGKTCPCDERIVQIHQEIWPRVRAILNGTTNNTEGFLMTLSAKEQEVVAKQLDDIASYVDLLKRYEVVNLIKNIDEVVERAAKNAWRSVQRADAAEAKLESLTAAFQALADSSGLDGAAITAAIDAAVADALANISITLTTDNPEETDQ